MRTIKKSKTREPDFYFYRIEDMLFTKVDNLSSTRTYFKWSKNQGSSFLTLKTKFSIFLYLKNPYNLNNFISKSKAHFN